MSTVVPPHPVGQDAAVGQDRAGGTARGRRVGAPGPRPRRAATWVLVVAVALVLAALTALVQGDQRSAPAPLDPDSTTNSGSRALVRVLEQQGTPVAVVHEADRLPTDGAAGDTVFVADTAGVLDPAVARRLARTVAHVVLVSDDPRVLDAFGIRLAPAGEVQDGDTVSTASCGIPAAAAARRVSADGTAYAPEAGDTDAGLVLCAPSGSGPDRAWGLVRAATPAGDVTLVGTTAAFRNDTITTAGNAALALGLLETPSDGSGALTWYVPTPGSPDAAPTLGTLAPPWVPSLLGILGLVAVAAAVWRGRRLGPLVVEQLPVVVRAAETTEGRARLYARAADRTHALDTLRIAALRRTARRLGLPRSAHVDQVVRAAATATGLSDRYLGAVLVGGPVPDDRALVAGAEAIDAVEEAVRVATGGAPARRRAPSSGRGRPERHVVDGRRPPQPTDQGRADQRAPDHQRADQRHDDQHRPDQHRPDQHRPDQHRSDQHRGADS
ncbi:DUF4350 domain-containing protein [Curtobacterium sp. MCSS17_008]|uniref:DUF4350 domain-containing protein n=1 Tax=Curtobacterium sp. MCSS17_008 TaxID=2175647 RepID=UPI000DA81751|nr:DUF4350 domain-containing protein [Curtobacterium sp. MCSS17_008]PZF52910.1 DUF4350 domain-containing protein [Curtobacterium sp. MCSS17_008]